MLGGWLLYAEDGAGPRPDWAPFHSWELKLEPLSFSLPGRLQLVFTGGNAALYSAGLGLLLRFSELHTFKDTY